MKLFSLYCASCEQEIKAGELAVLVAYVMVSDDHSFACRTTDLFHRPCWDKFSAQGEKDASSRSHNAPPTTS